MISYPIVVYHTPEDDGYFARVPALLGCTAHGKTPDEAVREALAAQELWVEAASARGLSLPELAVPAGAELTAWITAPSAAPGG